MFVYQSTPITQMETQQATPAAITPASPAAPQIQQASNCTPGTPPTPGTTQSKPDRALPVQILVALVVLACAVAAYWNSGRSDRDALGRLVRDSAAVRYEIDAFYRSKSTKLFEGQASILQEIKSSIQNGSRSVILGPQSFGKSTLMNALATQQPLKYACLRDVNFTSSAERFVYTLAHNLVDFPHFRALKYQVARIVVDSTPEEGLSNMLKLLDTVHGLEKHVLVIDELDDCLADHVDGDIVHLLAQTHATFPNWLSVVVATRPTNSRNPFPEARQIQLSLYDRRWLADVERFLQAKFIEKGIANAVARIACPNEPCLRSSIKLLAQKSGSFAHAGLFADALEVFHRRGADLAADLQGVEMLVNSDLHRIFEEESLRHNARLWKKARRLFDVLLASEQPSLPQLHCAWHVVDSEEDFKEVEDIVLTYTVAVDPATPDRREIYHPSFAHWLLKTSPDLGDAHRRLAACALLKVFSEHGDQRDEQQFLGNISDLLRGHANMRMLPKLGRMLPSGNNSSRKALHHLNQSPSKDQILTSLVSLAGLLQPRATFDAIGLAAQNGWTWYAKLMLRRNPSLGKPDVNPPFLGPIHVAAKNGHFHFVKMLVTDFHAPIDVLAGNRSPLAFAAQSERPGHLELMEALIDQLGADPRYPSVLLSAVKAGNVNSARLLCDKFRVDPNLASNCATCDILPKATALHIAVKYAHNELVAMFLHDHPVDCYALTLAGQTAMAFAAVPETKADLMNACGWDSLLPSPAHCISQTSLDTCPRLMCSRAQPRRAI